MINKGNKSVAEAYFGSRAIAAIYKGSKLVWTALRSICCFDGGVWKRDKTWHSNTTWRKN